MRKRNLGKLFGVIFLASALCFASYQSVFASQAVCNVQEQRKNNPIRIKAKVTQVKDGDTVEVLYYELPITVRLAHIDAPETRKSQPYGKAAKRKLIELCLNQEVWLVSENKFDLNGRLIAELHTLNGQNLNQEMVKTGYAWHFLKYSDQKIYSILQNEAQKHKLGLWAEPNPVPPWNYRAKKK